MRLAQSHPGWALGFQDESWWSRLSQPAVRVWAQPARAPRLVEQTRPSADPDPKALACYGLWLPELAEVWLRFVDGRPVSALTSQFLAWCCEELAARGKTALLLVWDNAGWHLSKQVRQWLREHNRRVRQTGVGVRIVPCFLPSRSPWLNPIEPMWGHAKRRVAQPDRLLSARELAERACAALGSVYHPHLSLSQDVA